MHIHFVKIALKSILFSMESFHYIVLIIMFYGDLLCRSVLKGI